VKRTLLWLIIFVLVALALVLYQRRSANRIDVTPDAERAIEKAQQR
jgi:hypothetical protein